MDSEWILFTGYQDGEIMNYTIMFDNHTTRQIWDGYQDFSMLEDAEVPPEYIEKFYLARQAGMWNKEQGDLKFPTLEDLDNGNSSLYAILVWDKDEFKETFKRWLTAVIDKKGEAQGDDSYFDYYPDLWFIADQIVEWAKDDPEYRELVQQGKISVYSEGLYHDEDTINHGQPVNGGITGIVQGKMHEEEASESKAAKV